MLEARLAVAVAVAGIGTLIDGVQTTLGLLVFHVGQPTDWLAPFWMAVLWMLFAITLRYAPWWLNNRPLAAADFGDIGCRRLPPDHGAQPGCSRHSWGGFLSHPFYGFPGSYRFIT